MNTRCDKCGRERTFYPVTVCDQPNCNGLFREVASEAKPPQAVTASASCCPSARATGDQDADTSSHCPDKERGAAAAKSADEWAVYARSEMNLASEAIARGHYGTASAHRTNAEQGFECEYRLRSRVRATVS